jgi:hypothetical protein
VLADAVASVSEVRCATCSAHRRETLSAISLYGLPNAIP